MCFIDATRLGRGACKSYQAWSNSHQQPMWKHDPCRWSTDCLPALWIQVCFTHTYTYPTELSSMCIVHLACKSIGIGIWSIYPSQTKKSTRTFFCPPLTLVSSNLDSGSDLVSMASILFCRFMVLPQSVCLERRVSYTLRLEFISYADKNTIPGFSNANILIDSVRLFWCTNLK